LNKKPPMLRNCPAKLRFLLTKCWDQNPEERLSMSEIVPMMEELFSHCPIKSLTSLNLVPMPSVMKEGKVIISNIQPAYNNDNTLRDGSNGTNDSIQRRISNDDLASTRITARTSKPGHRRTQSSDTELLLGPDGPLHHNQNNPHQHSEELLDIDPEIIDERMRNFNAYLVLEERHYPVQPDIKNSESIGIFEEHRGQSVRLLRSTFEIARLESYFKDLQAWENDPNRDDARIYMRYLDENRNLKKLRANLLEQLDQPRTSHSNSIIQQNQNQLEVANGWIMVDAPPPNGGIH